MSIPNANTKDPKISRLKSSRSVMVVVVAAAIVLVMVSVVIVSAGVVTCYVNRKIVVKVCVASIIHMNSAFRRKSVLLTSVSKTRVVTKEGHSKMG